jgi:hypothetical protein
MKWFKHDSDMHTDLKVQNLVDKYGFESYGIYNLCLELVAKEGKRCRLNGRLRWRQLILKITQWSDENKLETIISGMAEFRLICPKSLRYGNLYIPNMKKREDEYTQRKNKEVSGEGRVNIGAKNTTEYNRREENKNTQNSSFLLSSKKLQEIKKDCKGDLPSVKKYLLVAGLPEAAIDKALGKEF